MAIASLPPLFPDIFENQQFSYEITFIDGAAQIPGASLTVSNISINLPGNEDRNGFPPTLTATVVKYSTSSGLILSGYYPKLLNDSDWQVRLTSSSTEIVKYATYEEVKAGYYAGVKYRADSSNSVTVPDSEDSSQTTSVFVRVDTNLGTVFIPQTVRNNWTRKRNQVIPFVQGGQVDVNTNRYPGGSLGGSVGQDLFEPAPATGASFVDVLIQYETPGTESFIVPITVSSVTVRLTGAGGAGGDGYASKDFTGSGGGGGSGGFLETTIAVQTGQVYTLQIGAGGDRGGNRQGGVTSISRGTFNLSVTGGGAGGSGLPTVPGQTIAAGGTAGSPIGNVGRPGTISYTTSNQVGGRGADMFSRDLGTGGTGGIALDPTGKPGTGFGAGGGGAGTQRGTTSPWPGGAGSPGRIEIQFRGTRFIFIDNITTNTANYSVRAAALASGWDGQTPLDATITVAAGIYVYATSNTSPAFEYTNLPRNSIVRLINNGYIMGKGGNGGSGTPGENGGNAIVLNSTELYITNNSTGYIAGGGGGGAGPGGGGGAGGGNGGAYQTEPGGTGGDVGQAGQPGGVQFSGGGGGAGGGGAGAGFVFIQGIGSIPVGGTGGGGGRILPGTGGTGGGGTIGTGGAGGSSNQPGVTGEIGGGGGGWGANGGNSTQTTAGLLIGGLGGKAIETNGYDVNFTANTGTIYGSVSGSSITGTFSTAIYSNQTDLNLRTYTVNQGWNQVATAVVTVAGGTYVYSTATATPALTVNGSWPNGIRLNNYGYIMGRGGNGATSRATGGNGGPAIRLGTNLAIANYGFVAGGGGGGAGGTTAAGGGGAGGGVGGSAGTNNDYGVLAPGGAGGGPGQSGGNGSRGLDFRGVYSTGSGGGGGRIVPGVGGAGGAASASNLCGGRGGGAGGGGGAGLTAYDGWYIGGAGGSANNPGSRGRITGTDAGGSGGGGWGASGPSAAGLASIGGRAVELSGNTIVYFNLGTIYGAVS